MQFIRAASSRGRKNFFHTHQISLFSPLAFHSSKSRCEVIRSSSTAVAKGDIYITRYVKNFGSALRGTKSILVVVGCAFVTLRYFCSSTGIEAGVLCRGFQDHVYVSLYTVFFHVHNVYYVEYFASCIKIYGVIKL